MQLLIYSFLQPPVTSSLLGPNILLSTLFILSVEVISSPKPLFHRNTMKCCIECLH
jgi:hypothetical protein